MRISTAILVALALMACDSKPASEAQSKAPPEQNKQTAAAPLTDLTTASSLASVRAAFNAHKGEARFLTLLSPT